MGALAKLSSYPEKMISGFFVTVLPQLPKLIMFAICMLYRYYKFVTLKYKYASMINNKSSKFCCNKKRRPDLGECSVCLSEFEQGEVGMELEDCKHVFHKKCLEIWLKGYKATCPMCRSRVVPEVIVEEYHKIRSDKENDWIEKELILVFVNALDMVATSCDGFF